MKKHPFISRLVILAILVLALMFKQTIAEWVYRKVIWKDIPERVQAELHWFRFQCTGFSLLNESRITQVSEKDLPDTIAEWLPEYISRNDISNTNEFGYQFNFSESTPYFFKCQHDQFMLVWYARNQNTDTSSSMVLWADEQNIWRTLVHGQP